ncbi:MAG TPA: tetratricopeptide repeat protein [Candidatus Acidoferrales bacterium]|nr:tetratricopeptide repeat protein [Candidatus Acidoferrales bacterium]
MSKLTSSQLILGKLTVTLAVAALAALGTGCNKLQSRDHLNKGVQAFTAAQYPEAVEHFKTAVELDPNFPTARLYLATAYMQQYIPGAESPENMKMATEAYNQFQKVLEQEPKNTTAIASIASLNLNQKKWDEAQQWYEKWTAVEQNADAYYSLGFIAWSKWYPVYGTARANLGMKQEDPGPIKDKKVKEELKAKYGPIIEAGLQSLDKALQINPEYDDAMAYENLLVRERADLADSKEDYEKQTKIADDWVTKALATKKIKLEKKAKTGGGIVNDTGK